MSTANDEEQKNLDLADLKVLEGLRNEKKSDDQQHEIKDSSGSTSEPTPLLVDAFQVRFGLAQ